ncbi:MAG TPA: XRE family transcriptional regulator, partial [Sulfurospirillum arcachonense]|nr:XRE family transcriptional regulator [Sulfurospirillum arcachonense]
NETITKVYQKGYSQHMIAKVLGMAQSTINGIHLTPMLSMLLCSMLYALF